MRYSDISNKEMIDMDSGSKLGMLGQTDIEINEETGRIEAFVIPNYKWFGLKKETETEKIYWEMIEKIGKDIILISLQK